jgi:two-component system, LuxR family, response regulator FixJ
MESERFVFIVDDDPKMLRIVADVLSAEGIQNQVFSRGADFLESYKNDRRGCVLLDIQMPGLSGPELQRELSSRRIELPIIFLTANADVPTTVELMKRGAIDVLVKPFDVPTLLAAVNNAIEQDAISHADKLLLEAVEKRLDRLTPREYEVMELVVKGRANKQIAYELKLSEKTVEIHRSRVMKKMEAESIADLVRQCLLRPKPPRKGV